MAQVIPQYQRSRPFNNHFKKQVIDVFLDEIISDVQYIGSL